MPADCAAHSHCRVLVAVHDFLENDCLCSSLAMRGQRAFALLAVASCVVHALSLLGRTMGPCSACCCRLCSECAILARTLTLILFCMQVAFMLPVAYPMTFENFNYAPITVIVAIAAICLAWYLPRYGARHAFRAGQRRFDQTLSGRVSPLNVFMIGLLYPIKGCFISICLSMACSKLS